VRKFSGDRPRQLKDVKDGKVPEKKTSAVKHKTAGNYRCGRPNNVTITMNDCVRVRLYEKAAVK